MKTWKLKDGTSFSIDNDEIKNIEKKDGSIIYHLKNNYDVIEKDGVLYGKANIPRIGLKDLMKAEVPSL